ncbi:hypothetical protein [Streptomyces sp. AM6-12]|uniref:hypothetical protein n=1 Tax=Streptomyces sp. AM6-12 TaxID=3345149 RepID=UPI00379E4781
MIRKTKVVVCVMVHANTTGRLPVAERLDRLRAAATGMSNVTVGSHTGGLLVGYCRRAGIDVVVRGVRSTSGHSRHRDGPTGPWVRPEAG